MPKEKPAPYILVYLVNLKTGIRTASIKTLALQPDTVRSIDINPETQVRIAWPMHPTKTSTKKRS